MKISLPQLEFDWAFRDADRDAGWELYIERLTRITTQPLPQERDEETALNSVNSLFSLTRNTIKRHGRLCREFTKLAIVVLNQIVWPFTARFFLKEPRI